MLKSRESPIVFQGVTLFVPGSMYLILKILDILGSGSLEAIDMILSRNSFVIDFSLSFSSSGISYVFSRKPNNNVDITIDVMLTWRKFNYEKY